MGRRDRLDRELVRRGLAADVSEASEVIARGEVLVSGAVATNPARQVDPGQAVVFQAPKPPYVSRAGAKLAAGLDRFGIDVGGARALDVGSSTGGFTDCLLQRGASRVLAVDVGTHQLHESLRADERVIVAEQTDIRQLPPSAIETLGGPPTIVAIDVSFVALAVVLPAVFALVPPVSAVPIVALIKPQFEATKAEADKGEGVITDPAIWRRAIESAQTAVSGLGGVMMDLMVSPVRGQRGNVEFVSHLTAAAAAPPAADDRAGLEAAIESALVAATAGSLGEQG